MECDSIMKVYNIGLSFFSFLVEEDLFVDYRVLSNYSNTIFLNMLCLQIMDDPDSL